MDTSEFDQELEKHRRKASPGRYKLPPRAKQKGEISGQMKHARNLYLYGNGDGKPVRNADRLAELAGLHRSGVARWLPEWEREAVAIAKRETQGKLQIPDRVTGEMVGWHGSTVTALRATVDSLAETLATLTPGSDLHRDTLKSFLAALKKWEESSGFNASASTAEKLRLENLRLVNGKSAPEFPIDSGDNAGPDNFPFQLE